LTIDYDLVRFTDHNAPFRSKKIEIILFISLSGRGRDFAMGYSGCANKSF